MAFALEFTDQASTDLDRLEADEGLAKRLKAVRKALGFLETNPRHPGLHTHEFDSLKGPADEEVFEASAENRTPVAWRIFWFYGPDRNKITILAITPHP